MATTAAVPLSDFSQEGRKNHSIVAELEGGLLISTNPFPYFMVVALEAGGPLRSLMLLLLYPLVWFLRTLVSEDAALCVTTFVSTAGLRLSDVKAVAKSNLPRFYLEDVGKEAYMALSGCGGKKYVVTSTPRVMVEPFLNYVGVDCVVGTELRTVGGRCLGLVNPSPDVTVGDKAAVKLRGAVGMIDVGIMRGAPFRQDRHHPFMSLCRETYVSPEEKAAPEVLPRSCYPTLLIFHDGRLVSRPTPSHVLMVLLWLPLGFCLAVTRFAIGRLLPYGLVMFTGAATGMRIETDIPPQELKTSSDGKKTRDQTTTGTMYVCSHRTLLDPVMIACALGRRVTAVTYSLSRLSEAISPIPNFRLTRDRTRDGEMMRSLLEKGDLVVCPEGTTCREPYLLRFSPLFAEVAEEVVPVAVTVEGASLFYGTTVRGHKWLDSLFFLMNPNPCYKIRFLEKVRPKEEHCSSVDVANHVQSLIADALGFQCTNYTRKDKYRMIAGNDGIQ